MPHDNYELGLTPIDGSDDLILISFKPTPRDTIAPVIPPGVFAKMKQVKLDTRTALGSLSNSAWRVPDGPIAVRTPAPIFTKPKSYEVVLGPVLYVEEAPFDACFVDYFDRERPKPGEQVPKAALFMPSDPDKPHRNPPAPLVCPTQTLYRGHTLTVGLPKSHDGYQFAILDPDWNIMIISFTQNRHGRIAPVIPPDRFASMKEVRLVTTDARGSLYGPPVPTGTPPQPIFTKTGWYLVMTGTDFSLYDNGPFGTCWVHYINDRGR